MPSGKVTQWWVHGCRSNLPGKKKRAHLFCFLDDHSPGSARRVLLGRSPPRLERVLKVGILKRGLLWLMWSTEKSIMLPSSPRPASWALPAVTPPYAPESKENRKGSLKPFVCNSCQRWRLQLLARWPSSTVFGPGWNWFTTGLSILKPANSPSNVTGRDAGVRQADGETLRKAFCGAKRRVRKDGRVELQATLTGSILTSSVARRAALRSLRPQRPGGLAGWQLLW